MELGLRRKLPPNRSYEQIKNHYVVEKEIAGKLRHSNRNERTKIYHKMYEELFKRVPDHPRLIRQRSDKASVASNNNKLALLSRFLCEDSIVVEFGPGGCRFAYRIASHVKKIYGVDISDQRKLDISEPGNFELIIYDGYDLDEIETNSVDLVFSDQFIEHIHPEDTILHFRLVKRVLKPQGRYLFRTPSAVTGPHDISKYFSDTPQGFHLREWTYRDIKEEIFSSLGFSELVTYWNAKRILKQLPFLYFASFESLFDHLPKSISRIMAKLFEPCICAMLVK